MAKADTHVSSVLLEKLGSCGVHELIQPVKHARKVTTKNMPNAANNANQASTQTLKATLLATFVVKANTRMKRHKHSAKIASDIISMATTCAKIQESTTTKTIVRSVQNNKWRTRQARHTAVYVKQAGIQ